MLSRRFVANLQKQWFLLAMVIVSLIGYLFADQIRELSFAVNALIALIMFLIGLKSDWGAIARAVSDIRAMFFSLFFSFVVFPLVAFGLGKLFFASDRDMLIGLVVISSVGVTVGSSIVWTRLSRGNETLSIVLSVVLNVASCVLGPLIIFLFLGAHVELPVVSMIESMTLITLGPLLLAQIARRLVGTPIERLVPYTGPGSQMVILTIIMIAVARAADVLTWGTVLVTLPIVVLLHWLMLLIGYQASRRSGFTTADAIAITYGVAQKTMTTSLFITVNFFTPAALLPCLLYHLVQQLTAVFLVEWYNRDTPVNVSSHSIS